MKWEKYMNKRAKVFVILSTIAVILSSNFVNAADIKPAKLPVANSVTRSFMPDNSLWKEDRLDNKSKAGEAKFKEVIKIGKEIYAGLADDMGEDLIINAKWSDPTVNANATRYGGKAIINMYGGLFRRSEVTVSGFALVMCHELNHLYGWYPYLNSSYYISAEGQADYAGAKYCVMNVIKKLKDDDGVASALIKKACNNYRVCERALMAGESMAKILSADSSERDINYQTPDRSVVGQTVLTYPSTVQCRMDSYYSGTLGFARPKCWFYK